jgi:hypothetical protein
MAGERLAGRRSTLAVGILRLLSLSAPLLLQTRSARPNARAAHKIFSFRRNAFPGKNIRRHLFFDLGCASHNPVAAGVIFLRRRFCACRIGPGSRLFS